MCRSRGVKMLVDGFSSFGAEAIDFAGCDIDAVAAYYARGGAAQGDKR
ncbi:hypothetical protein BCEP4_1370001 [Burkholderia cepacia]|nr:hypothetical protein BCEP4_1370001 [Burkholderia cepacia]